MSKAVHFHYVGISNCFAHLYMAVSSWVHGAQEGKDFVKCSLRGQKD